MKAWADSLNGINYPLLSDFWPHGEVAERYGVLRSDGTSERAIFIIDQSRTIQYIDIYDIDDQPDNQVLLDELKKIIPEAEEKLKHLYKAEKPVKQAELVMYCTPWCPDCRKARVWLDERQISYSEVDISLDLTASRKVRMWGGGSEITPVFELNGKILVDFNENELTSFLGLSNTAP